jgi:hypothetical protein
MRSHLRRQGFGAPLHFDAATTTNAACSGQLTTYDDTSIINAASTCMQTAIQSTSFAQKVSSAWAAAEKGAAAGAAAGLSVGLTIDAGVTGLEDLIADVGFDFIAEDIETAVVLVTTASESAAADIGLGAGAGSSLGPVGALVGFIVGVIIAVINILLESCNVQITNGTTVGCSDYVNTNLKGALTFLQAIGQGTESTKLVGMTPLWVANTFNIFLANPVWMYVNQQALGITQPAPPGWAGGPAVQANADTITQIYFTLPGAFEALNRVQLAAAASAVAGSPSKMPFWTMIVNPPANVFGGYAYSFAPISNYPWTPGIQTTDINSLVSSTYSAPPNLLTNSNVGAVAVNYSAFSVSAVPPPGAQTAPPSGVYMLQAMYPSLSAEQCNAIFNANMASYETVVTNAQAWANTQCNPTPAMLGTGSQWNLEPVDVSAILQHYAPTNLTKATCLSFSVPNNPGAPVPGSSVTVYGSTSPTTSTSTLSTTVLKGASLVGGLGAIGIALYAAHGGVGVAAAAKALLSKTKMLLPRRVR